MNIHVSPLLTDPRNVTIFGSGGLDEAALAACEQGGAPIDGYGTSARLCLRAPGICGLARRTN